MAAGVRQAEITLVLRALNEMGGPLKEAHGQVTNFSDAISRGLHSAVSTASAAFVIGAGAIGAWALHATMGALRAGEMQVALVALAKANGLNITTLDSYVAAIRKQGIEMNVAQNLVAQFVQGHLDLAKAQSLAKVAQDAAVISGQNSTETLAQLVEGIRTQQTEVLRSAGITIDAQSAYTNYAKAHHVAASAITSTMKQQIILDEVLKQGITIQGAYAAALETPSKQLRSLPRIFDDISLNVGRSFLPALGGVITAGYELAKAVSAATAKGQPLANVLDVIGTVVGKLLAPLQSLAPRVETFLKHLNVEHTKLFIDEISRLAPLLATLAGILGSAGLAKIPFIGEFLPVINPLLGGMLALVAASPPLRDAFTKMFAALQPVFAELAPIMTEVLQHLSEGLTQVVEAVTPVIPVLGQFAGLLLDEVVKGLAKFLPPLIDVAVNLATGLAPALTEVLTTLKPLVPPFADLGGAAETTRRAITPVVILLIAIVARGSLLIPILSAIVSGWAIWNGIILVNNGLLALNAALAGGPGLGAFLIRVIAATMAMGPLNAATALWNLLLTVNPVGVVVTGIAILIGLLVLLVAHWDQVRIAVHSVYVQIEPLTALFNRIGDAISVFNIFMREGFGQTKAFEEALQALGIPLEHIHPLAHALSVSVDAVRAGLAAVNAVGHGVVDFINTFVAKVRAGEAPISALAGAMLKVHAPLKLIEAAMRIAGTVTDTFASAVANVHTTFDAVSGVIRTVVEFVSTFIEKIRAGEHPVSALAGALIAVHVPLKVIETIMHVLGDVMAGVGTAFAPVSKALRDAGKDLGPTFSELGRTMSNAWKQLLDALAPLYDALAPLIPVLVWIAHWIGESLVRDFHTFIGVMRPLLPILGAVAMFLGAQIVPMLQSFGLVLGVVGAIIGALLTGTFSGLVAFLTVAIPAAIQLVSGVIQILIGVFMLFVDIFTGKWDKLGGDVMRIVNGLKDVVIGAFHLIATAPLAGVQGFIQGVVGFFQWLYDQLVGHSIIPDLINAVVNWFRNLASFVTAPLAALWSGVNYWFNRVHDSVFGWVSGLANAVRGVWDGMVAAAGGAASGIWGAIKGGLNTAIDFADTFITKARDFLHNFGLHVLDSVWIPKLASGGLVPTGEGFKTSGPVAIVGEGNPAFPEWVIPSDPHYRKNALSLLWEAASEMGLAMAGGGALGEYISSPWFSGSHPVTQVPFTPGGSHANLNAWDYAMPMATQVFAGAPGVSTTGLDPGGYGNYIRFLLDSGGQVILGHLQQILMNGHAAIGQLIALSDNTGFSTGPHLHFEVLGGSNDVIGAGQSTGKMLAGLVDAAISTLKNQIKGGDWGAGVARSYLDMMGKGVKTLLPFDQGGVWPSGTAGVNTSGKSEYVLTPDQMRATGGPSMATTNELLTAIHAELTTMNARLEPRFSNRAYGA